MLYSAGIKHDKSSVISLFVTEFRLYDKKIILFRLFFGAILVMSAIILSLPTPVRGIMIAAGAWFISSTDFPAGLRADENIRKFRGNFPNFKYEFNNSFFTVIGRKSMNIDYSKIEHLVSDKDFVYIFMGKDNAIMLKKSELKSFLKESKNDVFESFQNFLEEKTAKKFEVSKSLISLNLFDLLDIFKNRK